MSEWEDAFEEAASAAAVLGAALARFDNALDRLRAAERERREADPLKEAR